MFIQQVFSNQNEVNKYENFITYKKFFFLNLYECFIIEKMILQ